MRRSVESILLLVALACTFSDARATELVFQNGFESGEIEPTLWNAQVYDPVEGAIVVAASAGDPVRSGEYALRMKLAFTDPLDPGGKRRSELRPRSELGEIAYRAPFGVPHVYEFSIQLPSDWYREGPEIVAQWHGRTDRDASGVPIEPNRSPPLALRMTNVEFPAASGIYVPAWNIVAHWDDESTTLPDMSTVTTVTVLEATNASPDLGQWVDWRFEVTWDWNTAGDGHVRVLKNGVEVAVYDGPNAFNDDDGPNSKIGLYKWNWPGSVELRVAYYDDVRIFAEIAGVPALGSRGGVAAGVVLAVLGIAAIFVRMRTTGVASPETP